MILTKQINWLLKNRSQLFETKKKITSQSNIQINNINVNTLNLISENINFECNILKNNAIKKIFIEKIKNIDPWYTEICKLKKLPVHVKKLAINTAYNNTIENWYIYLDNKRKYLLELNSWVLLKKALTKITQKKIQLIIEEKIYIKKLTPYELCQKIYKETILEEYSSLIKDPNIKFLKKFFNITLQKHNIDLI